MKKFIKKSLSVFLMLMMLVPLIGIMTSAQEPAEIENIYVSPKEKDMASIYAVSLDYQKYDIKPGDVITVGPISINRLNNSAQLIAFRAKNENGSYKWTNVYAKMDTVVDNLPGTSEYIVQFVVPELDFDRVNSYIPAIKRDSMLITVNRPFTAEEYLAYVNNKGIDLSFLYPTEYSSEFVNVFPKSDDVFGGWIKTQKVDGVNTPYEVEHENYYTSAPVSVNAGDLICIAGPASKGYYQVWFFNSETKYVNMSSSDSVCYYNNGNNCKIDAIVVPAGATSMRVVAYKDAYENGNIVVTVNQPMASANAYNSCKKLKVSGIQKEYTYTGKVIKPAVELKIGGNVLELGKDYKLTYGNKNVGSKKLTITFINNYAYLGKVVYSYRIVPKPVDVIWSNTQLVYNGENQAPVGEVVGLIGSDKCNVVVDGAVKCGSYISAVRLSNTNYTLAENATCEYTISPKPVELVWSNINMVYSGYAQAPIAEVLGVVDGDVCDVTVSGANAQSGTYVAVAALSNSNYVISQNTDCSFTIAPKEVVITWENTDLFYTGRPQQPTVKVYGTINGEDCGVNISGWGEELGSYTATATISNPNYLLTANTSCDFTVRKSTIHESVGMPAEFVIDVLAVVPDSAEKAAAEAVTNSVTEAVTTMTTITTEAATAATEVAKVTTEAAQEVASEIAESVSNTFANLFGNLFGFFKNFGW